MASAPATSAVSHWRGEHVAAIGLLTGNTIPTVDPATLKPILPAIDLWDLWPLQLADGSTARVGGWGLWFVLSAPALPDPESRHAAARIRLMATRDGQWRDCGDALPDGLSPRSVPGPWLPVNRTGLAAANPDSAAYQTYNWWVDDDLAVWGLVDYPAAPFGAVVDDPAWRHARFGGTPAPRSRIVPEGESPHVAHAAQG